MTSEWIMNTSDLGALLEGLGRERDLFGPVKRGGGLAFAPVDKPGDLVFEFSNPEMSVKEFFFPQSEVLMRFEGEPIMRPEPGLARDRVVLNVRPCDARAMVILDDVFLQDKATPDNFWQDKREHTLLVGLACDAPCESCFCAAVGGGPHDATGLDILLTDLGERLLVTAASERGGQALAGIEALREAGEADLAEARARKERAEGILAANPAGQVPQEALRGAGILGVYDLPLWERLAGTCLNCGVCTFSCPTCHCFDIQDESRGLGPDRGRRVRNWDTCMSWLFTQHASGHNPRGTKVHRARQRFMHKFVYMPQRLGGVVGCVGCGRCVVQCPVNIDIRQVVAEMNAGADS